MQDLLGLEDLTAREIDELLDLAQALREVVDRPIKKVPTLRGRAVVNLFFEPSTRTRSSFELASKYLSADVINFSGSHSSVQKGETIWDTAQNLTALGVDAVVVRHGTSGVPRQLADLLRVPVINAGDGSHEHPTQGLLDLLTVRQCKGTISGLKVAIVGDVLHSRVARSDLFGFRALGAEVTLVGPPALMPDSFAGPGVRITHNLAEGMRGADVVQVLRIQRERQAGGYIPSLEEYRERWGITRHRLQWADADVVVLHPGPQNRGVEIDSDVLDGESSRVLSQVTNGVAVRMAVLYRLLGGTYDEPR
ncbi:MAG: aspartate carbamoyltransferase catalytic subunit [Thermaerobacter sp.]|nr:aspartate carbamoyltransferase catalytic subunit [Thermaerobacter sp.]